MKITILCSSSEHPINTWLDQWISDNKSQHHIDLIRNKTELSNGDILFLISCSEIITENEHKHYKKSLVIHASELPKGRGWSPHIWQILNAAEEITVTLLEADEPVDSGDIWKQVKINIPKTALYDEINSLLFEAELELMQFALTDFHTVKSYAQTADIEPSYYPKRTPSDSEIDPALSITEQFNKIRVCDPRRFPAFFHLHGNKFHLKITKANVKKETPRHNTNQLDLNDFTLRKIKISDNELIFNWRNSNKITKFMCSDHTIVKNEHVRWFKNIIDEYSDNYKILEYKGRPIGQINISRIDEYNKTCHWGFYIGDNNAPKGSGTVLAYLALEYIFVERQFRKVYGEVLSFNKKSISLHERIGFFKEGLLSKHVLKDDSFRDVILYAISKQQWLESQN